MQNSRFNLNVKHKIPQSIS